MMTGLKWLQIGLKIGRINKYYGFSLLKSIAYHFCSNLVCRIILYSSLIHWPSCILACGFAIWMLYLNPDLLLANWMLVKIGFVGLLLLYHLSCQIIYRNLQRDIIKMSSFKLRIFNEISTILLFAIVFLVVLKNTISWVWGVVGIVAVGGLLMAGINLYKKIRQK